MAKPRVFVSSTFYDLKYIRASIEKFVIDLGFEPILSEKGSITYNPDLPLDESCYREAQACDIFVMIIGGRYGSEISATKDSLSKDFHDRYMSITRQEYEYSVSKNIPSYIFIDRGVYSEFELYKNNRENKEINYVQVDSVNIFDMIENIFGQLKNNPIHPFDKFSEIESWLKEQWAGLFRDLLLKRSDRNNLLSLSAEIQGLRELKESFELIVANSSVEIEKPRVGKKYELDIEHKIVSIKENIFVQGLVRYYDVKYEEIIKIFEDATCLEDIAKFVDKYSPCKIEKKLLVEWRTDSNQLENVNAIRRILKKSLLYFKNEEERVEEILCNGTIEIQNIRQ